MLHSLKRCAVAFITVLFIISSALADNLIAAQDARPAPLAELSLKTNNNTSLQIADFKGKVVLIDFWASWCEPCRDSFPWMNELKEKYDEQDFEIIAVNLDEDIELAKGFLQQVPAQFKVVYDEQKQLPNPYGLVGMPSSYLLDREGRIRSGYIGFYNEHTEHYEVIIQSLLKEAD